MPDQTADQKPEFAPLWDIPDAWAKAHCPVCGEAALAVVHLPDFPDYLKCANCEIAFDVERGGRLIRLRYIPEELISLDESLRFAWVQAPSVRRDVRKRFVAKERKESNAVLPASQGLTDEEVLRRAVEMYRLGNAPRFIEASLMRAGASQEQVRAISIRMKRQAEIDSRKQTRKFMVIAGIAGLLVLSLGAWLVGSGYFSAQKAASTPSTFAENLPAPVQHLLPTTAVSQGGSRAKHDCPTTSEEAAALFGGEAGIWSPAQYGAWQMMNIESSITVHIPAGMTAGFIKNQSLQFSTVSGPATIYGVNFITIMCE